MQRGQDPTARLLGRMTYLECAREDAAHAGGAGCGNLAPHEFCQPARDHQTQSSSAKTPRRRGIGLNEGLEQTPHRLVGNAHPSVLDLKLKRPPAPTRDGRNPHVHGAVGRKLDRVANQIEKDLADAPGIAQDHPRQIGIRIAYQGQALFFGLVSDQPEGLFAFMDRVEVHGLKLQTTSLNLRKIEDVIDQDE